jgi:CRP-like cAMP-binding protein
MATRSFHVPGENRLLVGLPEPVQREIEGSLERVSLGVKHLLYDRHAHITAVYFPLTCVASMVVVMEDGGTVEVGTVGNEGMVGTPLLLGTDRSMSTVFCQIPGEALRMSAEDFKRHIDDRHGPFASQIARYQQVLTNQIAQSVACNHLHSVEERTARWLLMTHDRVGKDEFPLTQEFLSQMLGVRRPSVTIAAGLMEKAGLITYKRGRITIVNREGLEATTCECYGVVRAEYERLLGDRDDD